MKKVLVFLRGFLLAPFILYLYNVIAVPLNIIVPINLFNTIIVGFLGIPGLILLVIFKLIAF